MLKETTAASSNSNSNGSDDEGGKVGFADRALKRLKIGRQSSSRVSNGSVYSADIGCRRETVQSSEGGAIPSTLVDVVGSA
ncbi:hypothetical protein F441_03646 [Phytophthora nicotianae CJ01A1]|uniref:Uncharacterized protein n=2 Tax=Phytophthora nicotianae TaxID=4792 RepID=W2ZDS4_PHYNI|nr:hypothetical protein F441_03646 [Phytophthora nicotianae CJ01A1]ETP44329.1 hypothetical protein F442_09064 [Phytophthora nicotianae P10297]